jgi:hypothetical protein
VSLALRITLNLNCGLEEDLLCLSPTFNYTLSTLHPEQHLHHRQK